MRKEAKGAVAAAAAVTLLVGGGGTLAYWTATHDAGGAETINAGELSLATESCGDWLLDGGLVTFTGAEDLVPGDTLTKTCSSVITASGEHLLAELSAEGGALTGTLAPSLTLTSSFEVGGQARTEITDADNGETLISVLTVTFDGTSDNTTQNFTAALADILVTASQVHD